ncbi:type II toxin-antitoxin system PemK/MazF family toxin [Candidatus Woesearchaeota archaeon]|nr:type II toxin-antitoxin system PemK/MazF family toxin [Candidatus Woesearchaeota archaeon]
MPFPYSDLSGKKVRPVLVVSNNQFNAHSQDLIVCCVTSNISKDSNISKEFHNVMLPKKEVSEGKLFEDCCVKVENIAKIEKALIIKKIGRVSKSIFSQVSEKLQRLVSSENTLNNKLLLF